MPELAEKKALVTGATSGIGKATALALAAAGATVAVSGRDKEKGQAVVDAIEAAGGSAVLVAGDLVDADAALDLAVRATEALGGQVDILVNSAGTFPFGPTASHDETTLSLGAGEVVGRFESKAQCYSLSPRGCQIGIAPLR